MQLHSHVHKKEYSHGLVMASVAMLGSQRSRIRSAVELRADAQQKIATTESPSGPIGIRNRGLVIGATTKRFFDALEL